MARCRKVNSSPELKRRQNANRSSLLSAINTRGYATVNDFQLALKRAAKALRQTGRGADREMADKHVEMAEAIRDAYCEVYGCDSCDC